MPTKLIWLLYNQSLSPPDAHDKVLPWGSTALISGEPWSNDHRVVVPGMGPEELHKLPTSRTEPSSSLHYQREPRLWRSGLEFPRC